MEPIAYINFYLFLTVSCFDSTFDIYGEALSMYSSAFGLSNIY